VAIVCGTDFSAGAAPAVRVASAFARQLGEPLVLVHVVDVGAIACVARRLADELAEAAAARLAELAASLEGEGLTVETRCLTGDPDERIAEVARETAATLVVAGVLGHRSSERWRVGSLATRLARAVPAPVLLVADAEPFERCARGERALRVLVAATPNASGAAAAGWIPTLRRLGPCDVLLLHVHEGKPGDVDVEALRERLAVPSDDAVRSDEADRGETELRGVPVVGWVADTLALVAERDDFDLILVGGRPRSGLARIRQDSVSEGLLRAAPGSVLRVPFAAVATRAATPPPLGTILVPSDLSPLAAEAARYAYALAPNGATVVLLHVVESAPLPNPLYAHYRPRPTPEERAQRAREAEASLRALVPPDAERRDVETRIEIVEGEPVEVIRARAERADVVCLATHGRSGLSRLLGGSVTRSLAASCPRPLLLVRPPPAD